MAGMLGWAAFLISLFCECLLMLFCLFFVCLQISKRGALEVFIDVCMLGLGTREHAAEPEVPVTVPAPGRPGSSAPTSPIKRVRAPPGEKLKVCLLLSPSSSPLPFSLPPLSLSLSLPSSLPFPPIDMSC